MYRPLAIQPEHDPYVRESRSVRDEDEREYSISGLIEDGRQVLVLRMSEAELLSTFIHRNLKSIVGCYYFYTPTIH